LNVFHGQAEVAICASLAIFIFFVCSLGAPLVSKSRGSNQVLTSVNPASSYARDSVA